MNIELVQVSFNLIVGDADYLVYFTPTPSRNCMHIKIVKNDNDLIWSQDKPLNTCSEPTSENAIHYLNCVR